MHFGMDTLANLEKTIASRSGADPASSYVAKLNARGIPVIARKLARKGSKRWLPHWQEIARNLLARRLM